jgi:hypothetical protein
MQSVGMMLKLIGVYWTDYHRASLNIFHVSWNNLKEYLRRPPKTGEDNTKAAATGKKQLLMLGLLITMKKAGSVPGISLLKENCKLSFSIKSKERMEFS